MVMQRLANAITEREARKRADLRALIQKAVPFYELECTIDELIEAILEITDGKK